MRILGLNAYHGDASAAVLEDGQLIAAVEEERYNRIKHWAGLPILAAKACLGSDPASVEHIAISRDPKANLLQKFKRVAFDPSSWGRLLSRAENNVKVANVLDSLLEAGIGTTGKTKMHHVEHHRAHMASAFFVSPFEEAAILSVDGFGDFTSVMWGVGKGNQFDVRGSTRFPHSLGLFYTAFTQLLGFPKYGDEYKMMGLAAYGTPRFADKVRQVVHIDDDQVILNLDYFRHHNEGVEMVWNNGEPKLGLVYSAKLPEVFGPAREQRAPLEQEHADLAASVQQVLEENYFALLRYVAKETGQKAICLAGGVALNCAANGKLFAETPFTDVYVQPAAHDAGTSIGAALYVQHQVLGLPRSYEMKHVYYGVSYTDDQIEAQLKEIGANYQKLSEDELVEQTADAIAEGKILGWFQGGMEFGPRALGDRSILADPRRADMKDTLNARIKYREPFRPFCPSILAEEVGNFFEIDYPSPFMVMAYPIKEDKKSAIPAVTHQDGTGRLQTVERDVNPLYWKLIRRFADKTGVPVLLNTSFNENEPIVNEPREAIECFLRTNMDVLTIGSFFLVKSENTKLSETRQAFAMA